MAGFQSMCTDTTWRHQTSDAPTGDASCATWAGNESPLRRALEGLPVTKLVFEHELLDDLHVDPFMGNLWRGQLGAWWHNHATATFEALMGLNENSRSWALEADWADHNWVPAGAHLRTVVTLMGQAVVHKAAVVDAMEAIGLKGLGSVSPNGRRARARLLQVQELVPRGVAHQGRVVTAADVMDSPTAWAAPYGLIQVDITRPLRIKEQGQVLIAAPTMEQLVRRVQGRLIQLLSEVDREPNGTLFNRETQAECIGAAKSAACVGHQLKVWTWRRHSGRTGQVMPLEGITGRLHFEGQANVLLPWLSLAEWLQVGTKTTFGFGVVKVS